MLQQIEAEIRAIPVGPNFRADMRAKTQEYKVACLELHGLTGHPKADAIWDFAWERGRSAGLDMVDAWVGRLAELIL